MWIRPVAALALVVAAPGFAQGQAAAPVAAPSSAPSPAQIVAAAPAADWVAIAADQLLVMDLAPGRDRAARRVVIQLLPAPWSQGWVGNIRKLAAAHWWDGTAINRVQDGYVVQWGDPFAEDKARARALPAGLQSVPQSGYTLAAGAAPGLEGPRLTDGIYAASGRFYQGWPIAAGPGASPETWPVHCYGTVGVGRDMPPDSGTGAELYAVIGDAPRQLDRNIAVVGRVISGMEWLSSLPRGKGEMGFYRQAKERTPIVRVRLGSEVPGLPTWQYLSTSSDSFARYVDARANRRDPFYIRPAGRVDICNAPVPIRPKP
ncbi:MULTISPECIES: peptidylprolyl isomerase [unclassified Novosphingobium]|uniref:peptidylprolyl isomerase n=1 Tax=unclassified Novosphingobium TaxID=2644732 RepID=UPI00146DF35C|nr:MULTISPECIES: peptidylprolyl isomerase [unclassified Novosphingobium]NMN06591.1 peptidylprolyl isomerase [Novosphingobium sp. SG919]NMN88959.1 peptidylprolyl isomerase [Novosphingobium sp. SG916]